MMITKERKLFTPGPLTTQQNIKQAMQIDYGSRDIDFKEICQSITAEISKLTATNLYDTVLLPGSGTYAIESVLSSISTQNEPWLVLINGAYGRRMASILQAYQLPYTVYEYAEDTQIEASKVDHILKENIDIRHVAIVHCETTTGILNDIEGIGNIVKKHHKTFVVDAMSSFGGIPIDFSNANIDYLISSANKCLESVPGIAFILAKKEHIEKEMPARNFALNLFRQWQQFKAKGEFLFTPPVQVICALQQALTNLTNEGGIKARNSRYNVSQRQLAQGMQALGFESFLPNNVQSPIITTFLYPNGNEHNANRFYLSLYKQGLSIYPGKLTVKPSFRIGTIGNINENDITHLLSEIEKFQWQENQ